MEYEGPDKEISDTDEPAGKGGRRRVGGKRQYQNYRGPLEFGELLKALGARLSDHEVAVRYYRERAMPHLVRFPTREMPEAMDPLPEGLETWDFGMPLEDADWLQSVLVSPHVVPGLTTVQRVYGPTPGGAPERRPLDLYLGVDCSGSMLNPMIHISYVVLAGAIMALSALRVGARVMVVLSGEPGESMATDGFVSHERAVLQVLTGYLGTGYSFGIHRLRDAFAKPRRVDAGDRPAHILIVSDHDIFSMLDGEQVNVDGWSIAREAVANAGGGGTYILNMPADWEKEKVARMHADGWRTHCVQNWEDLVVFARAFSQANYGSSGGASRGPGRAPA